MNWIKTSDRMLLDNPDFVSGDAWSQEITTDGSSVFEAGKAGRITYIEGFRFVASPPIDQYGVKRQVMDIVLGR